MKAKILGLLAVGLLTASGATNSAPLIYDESVGGDISPDAASGFLTVYTLGVGANAVSGRHGQANDGTGDFDPFRFVIPEGASLTGLTITWGNTVLSGDFSSGGMTTCSLRDSALNTLGSTGTVADRCVNVVSSPSGSRSLFSGVLPLGPGSFDWLYSRGISGVGSWFSDYRLDLTVISTGVSVPEPGTLALLGLGLAGLGLSRRRLAV